MTSLISIIIPARDEEKTIGLVLKDLNEVIYKLNSYEFEVIVVDDGSIDKTRDAAEQNKARVVANKGEHGKGRAMAAGFKEAKGSIIIMLDADYSHMPGDIPRFIKKIEEGYGLVVGSRSTGGSDEYTKIRTLGNVFLTGLFVLLFRVRLTDALNGYKAFRREVIEKHEFKSKDFEIEIELIVNALKEGFKIGEIPSHEHKRAGGRMKSLAYIHGPKFLWAIIKHGLQHRFTKNG